MINKDRAHILFLIDCLYSTAGGAEGVLRKLVRRLPQDRYRCSIATLASAPERVVIGDFDCPVYCLPTERLWDLRAIGVAWRLARMIRSEQVDLVHTFFEASDLIGGAVAKLTGRVVISSRRDMGFRRSRAHRLGYRLMAPWFDQVQTVAESVRRSHIEQDGLDPRKVVTVHNGVDLDAVDALQPARPAEWGIPASAPVIACVANIRPVKGITDLVRTAAKICRVMPEACFLVIGEVHDENYFREIRELARATGCDDRIVFCGGRTDVISILKTCSIFYLPSLSEGMSNALLEAMACRLPCVVTDVGGNPELVDDERTGYVVAAGNVRDAADRILELLTCRSRADEMGCASRRVVETKFSSQSMIDTLTGLYNGLLERAGNALVGAPARACVNSQDCGD
jgi:glycosyltransferase involved in cell wall biosynthesis